MSLPKQTHANEIDNTEKQWRNIFKFGGIITFIVILGTILDIIIGSSLSGTIPQTAIDRFAQLQGNRILGLYYLDLLNFVTTILMIPTYFVLCAAHRRVNIGYTLLAAIIYFIGAAVFITNNAALSMLELAGKYAAETSEVQKTLLAAAGEALLAKGAHGSQGAFPGFLLLTIASIAMSFGMLKGKIFSKTTSYIGITGGTLLLIYLVLVTFVPDIENMAMIVSAPGGILALVWMIMFDIRLFKLGYSK